MRDLPYLIPILFTFYISLGLAQPKTLAVSTSFALSIVWGIARGRGIMWQDRGLKISKRYIYYAFWTSLAIILIQLLKLGQIPLLNPTIRTQLSPRLTALTYFLGVPTSVYLFLEGRRYSLMYPLFVALYAYRTPVLVSILAIGLAYYEEGIKLERGNLKKLVGIAFLGIVLFGMITYLRGNTVSSLWVRFQSTVSALDVIVWRGDWLGTYHGSLQWAGVTSYFMGGYSPRGLIAKFLYVRTGATITATLLGGMYLDFGVFSIIEGFLLGIYYGMMSRAENPITKALYYSTLSYGIAGVETGILDLPVYLLFAAGIYVLYQGYRAGESK